MKKSLLIMGLAVIFLTALLAWLPFGIRMVGMAEEWRIMANFDTQINLGESYNRLRPLQTAPLLLSYLIQPDSFEVMNVLLWAALLAKGIGLFLLLARLFPQRLGMALVAALLFVYFPADEGVYVLRAMTHNVAVGLLTLGAYGLVAALQSNQRRYYVLYGVCTVISLFIYEVGYPIVVLIGLLPFLVPSLRGQARKSLLITAATVIGCGLVLVLIWLTAPPSEVRLYQSEIIERNLFSPGFFRNVLIRLVRVYAEHFAGGWLAAIQQLALRADLTVLAIVMSVISGAGIWFVSREDVSVVRISRRAQLLTVGFLGVMLLAGFVLFIPSMVRNDNWRVFLYTAAPAAVLISMGLVLLVQHLPRPRLLLSIASACLLALAYTKGLNQHAHFQNNSTFILHTLEQIMAQAPRFTEPVSLMILNVPEASDVHVDMFYHHGTVPAAIRYLQNDPNEPITIIADFCITSTRWRTKNCNFKADGVQVSFPYGDHTVSYASLLLFAYDEAGQLILQTELPSDAPAAAQAQYQPLRLIGDKAPSERMQYLFR